MGIFPMGEPDGSIAWYEASPRAIIPIELETNFLNISRSLKQVLNKEIFEIKIDTSFEKVIIECANRENTWINELIMNAFTELHYRGYAHSVEAWFDGMLAGGLYGVSYKGAFFGESMFFKKNNASKVCVVKLFELLKKNKYILFDIQMMTPHFEKFGAIEISKRSYLEILGRAMERKCKFKH
ncbi:MAG: leucyl/phenylalanyl-tRNA--protein transferase [Ignavibacteria bacterium]|nr:leucyl/phenylalanyl-tRNA--protein transferase [Ignavibacteria bacterium]